MSGLKEYLTENFQAEEFFSDWDGDVDVEVHEGPNFHDVYQVKVNGEKRVALDTWSLPDQVLVISTFCKEDDAKLTSLIQRLVAARDWLNQ